MRASKLRAMASLDLQHRASLVDAVTCVAMSGHVHVQARQCAAGLHLLPSCLGQRPGGEQAAGFFFPFLLGQGKEGIPELLQ